MAKKTLKIFISSKNKDKILYQGEETELSEIRRIIKHRLESARLFDKKIFEVWINEDESSAEGTIDAWEKCLDEVRIADIVLCIYNGDAGWTKRGGDIGICHAELKTARDSEPNKVRVVKTILVDRNENSAKESRNKKFQKYINDWNPFMAEGITGEELIKISCETIKESVIDLAYAGRLNPNKSAFFLGDSLKWSRFSYQERKEIIENTLINSLKEKKADIIGKNIAIIKKNKELLILKCEAIPDSLSISEAREMVGQPFLYDYEDAPVLEEQKAIGPIHLIGCHKTITESQARKILGFPNATLVKGPFGIYVADNLQMIQLIFLQDCRNETETIHVLQRFLDWLDQSGEVEHLLERAKKRKKIVRTISDIHNYKK